MLYDSLKKKLMESRKLGLTTEKIILSVVLGEADLIIARSGKVADEQIEKIIYKLIEDNEKTFLQKPSDILHEEITYLKLLLPQTLSIDEVKNHLLEIKEQIISGKEGVVIGIAVKFLKGKNLKAKGQVVTEAIKQLRENNV